MTATLDNMLVVAISSRALFDLEEENRVFDAEGAARYMQHQIELLDTPAKPGVAFNLARKLLAFNTPETQRVEIVMVSRNDPVSGMRVFNSAASMGIGLSRGVFTQGREPFTYLRPLKAHLYLSANLQGVQDALEHGIPAACVLPGACRADDPHPNEVRIAFDGDSVLFSDEAERVNQEQGLDAFHQYERENADKPLPPGPILPLLAALHRLQLELRTASTKVPMSLRTALVTARSIPAHQRAIRTLMSWGITVDEGMFLGGLAKGEFLQEFGADFFFDDSIGNIRNAASYNVPSGHVAAGVLNE